MLDNSNDFIQLGTLIVFLILLFLATREFWCWYWKINERNKLLKEQNEALKAIFQQLGGSIKDESEVDRKARLYDQSK